MNFRFPLSILRCPKCSSSNFSVDKNSINLFCGNCESTYPVVNQRPVLLRADNQIFQQSDYRNIPLSQKSKVCDLGYFIPSPSVNLGRDRVLVVLRDILSSMPSSKILVIGSGGQRNYLDKILSVNNPSQVIYTDIDVVADVDIFCDAHDLPFTNDAFDVVITTAVLLHVLYPERVASEIKRVLKTGGIVYSEMPFLQHVVEGAYDFTRYTLSGHRRLMNGFVELDSGMIAGPATVLVWAIESFALAFVKKPSFRVVTKAFVRLCFFWIKYFDYLLENKMEAMDGASCTYFLGRKIEGMILDKDIVSRYVGAKNLHHS